MGDYQAPDEINAVPPPEDTVTNHIFITKNESSIWNPNQDNEFYYDGQQIDKREAY